MLVRNLIWRRWIFSTFFITFSTLSFVLPSKVLFNSIIYQIPLGFVCVIAEKRKDTHLFQCCSFKITSIHDLSKKKVYQKRINEQDVPRSKLKQLFSYIPILFYSQGGIYRNKCCLGLCVAVQCVRVLYIHYTTCLKHPKYIFIGLLTVVSLVCTYMNGMKCKILQQIFPNLKIN